MRVEKLTAPLVVNLSVLMNRPTGISTYAKNLLPSLKSFDPILLADKAPPGFRSYEIPAGLSPDYGSKGHLKRLFWLQRRVPSVCREFGDGISGDRTPSKSEHSLLFSPSPEAPLYTDCRFVVTVHDTIPLRFPQAFPLALVSYSRHYVGRVLAQAEHIICDSVSTARDVTNFYQVPAHKLTSVALAYDRQNFRPSNTPKGNYFLYIGRQDTHKNLARLISAFSQVAKDGSGGNRDIELWLVGPQDPRYTPALTAQTASLALTNQVRFLDYVAYDRLPVLLGGAIALTFPSLWEGFGLPVLEAMACGTPVITSNLSSLPEVAGDAALLIDPYSTDELAEAMTAVLNDSSLSQQLKNAGLARASCFKWEKTGQQTADILSRFL